MQRVFRRALLVIAVLLAGAVASSAQPFTAWLVTSPGYPTTHGYVEVPHAPELNPTGAFTFEAWVSVTNSTTGQDCRTIAGKNYVQAWWIGVCTVSGQPTLRSYLKGGGSARDGGVVPSNVWTHIAVTFDGGTRRHYINGELAASFAETGPLTTSTSEMRIGSDVSWERSPTGYIEEVRLWNVARTMAEIRDTLNKRITAQPGLVAYWELDSNARDGVGGHDGELGGTGRGYALFAVGPGCSPPDGFTLCLNNRFRVRTYWRTNPAAGSPTDGRGQVAGCPNTGSGLFWFFAADNWELMVKEIDGCGLNNRHWIFSAATTNVFYRMEVLDGLAGIQKIYFNYPGPPAPAVTDTSAFATCP